jgi:predicted dehydrogenase
MSSIAQCGAAEIVAVADPSPESLLQAAKIAPAAFRARDLDELLSMDLDGVVIATPSAQHSEQSIRCLEQGIPVFCQKPLGRNEAETRAVVSAAKRADRLLRVDLSYRFTSGMASIQELVAAGELGKIFAVDLVFHNAYGPDKPWFYDRSQAGGGCLMDLGIHLVDLALWTLGFPEVEDVTGQVRVGGSPFSAMSRDVEDFAAATLTLRNEAIVRLACSWRLHAGRDAVITAQFHGTEGGASFRNVGGSFYDFVAERYGGTATQPLAAPPDDWGGRAAACWARALSESNRYDPDAERLIEVARVLDRIYAA